MYKVITIGDALIDTHIHVDEVALECDLLHKNCKLCFDYGSKIPITDSFQCLGGNAPNVAIAIKKLGLPSAIICAIGNDSNGKIVVDKLKKFKIDTRYISKDLKNKTRYSVILNYKGERTILSYSQKKNYIWPKKMPKTDWIYYTSLSSGFEKIHSHLFKYLKENPEIKLALNPGSYMMKFAIKKLRETIKKTDLLIVNKEEAERILGIIKSKSIKNLISKLVLMGAKEVAITDGIRGAWIGDEKNTYHSKSFPTKTVSKTGAGDAFSGGLLAAKIYGKDNQTSLSWGIANSCGVITEIGAQNGILNQTGIEKKIKENKNIKSIKI